MQYGTTHCILNLFIHLYILGNKFTYLHKQDRNWNSLFSLKNLLLHMFFHYHYASQFT